MSLETTYPFTTPANYTYDSDLVEVTGGKAQLKNQVNANEMAYCNFATKDLLRSVGGSLIGTLSGSAVITAGRLDATGGVPGSWEFNPTGMIGADANILTHRWKWTPQYTGSPGGNVFLFSEQQSAGNTSNQILIKHKNSQLFEVQFRSGADVYQGLLSFTFSPTAGVTYEVELNINSTTGLHELFIDGISRATLNAIYVRSANIAYCEFFAGGTMNNAFIDDYQRFDSVQHTAAFGSEVPRTVPTDYYVTSDPTIEPNSGITLDLLESLTEVATRPGADDLKYALRFNGVLYYHDGADWVVADGTYAQTNTIAEINADASTFPATVGGTLFPLIFLHGDTGDTTPDLDILSLSSSFYNAGTTPNKCILYGEIYDNCCEPVEGAKITVDGDDYFYDTALIARKCEAFTDEDGKWEMSAIETATDSKTVTVTISYQEAGEEKTLTYNNITIPNQSTASLASLV